MKKALFLFLSSVMFLSCDDENGQINQLKDDFSVLGKRMSSDIVVAFEKDVKNSNIDLEIKNWEKALNKQDFDKVETYQNSIVGILNSFYEKYKKESVEDYVKLLHEIEAKVLGTHDKDPCTRNKNGTIYLDACTFWQKVSFFISFSCSGLPVDTKSQQESYMNCLQSTVCKKCK